jgi:predicted metal-dependent peptidase
MFTLHTPTREEQIALDKVKIALMTRENATFYCEVGFSLKYRWTKDIPTAATNGVYLYINPDFFMALTPEQRLGLIIHEILHGVYMHGLRRGERDPRIWNMAGDYVINLIVIKSGFELPPQGLYDIQYRDLNTEAVYAQLMQQCKQQQQSAANGTSTDPGMNFPGIGEDLIDLPDDMSADEVKERIELTLIRASIKSQEKDAPGTIPGDIQLLIDKLLKPKLPWDRIFYKYLNQFNKNDYSFRKPNRRFFPEHHLPSLYSMSLMDITIGVDISGSVTDRQFKQFVAETASIFRMTKPKKITLIQFDTKIKKIDEIHSIEELVKVKFSGRGGTDIKELIEWANEHKPQLLVVFTDGDFNFRNYHSKRNVLWIIHNNPHFTPAFGKAIHYGIDG